MVDKLYRYIKFFDIFKQNPHFMLSDIYTNHNDNRRILYFYGSWPGLIASFLIYLALIYFSMDAYWQMSLGKKDILSQNKIQNPLDTNTIEFKFYKRGYMPNFLITMISDSQKDFGEFVDIVGKEFFEEKVEQIESDL